MLSIFEITSLISGFILGVLREVQTGFLVQRPGVLLLLKIAGGPPFSRGEGCFVDCLGVSFFSTLNMCLTFLGLASSRFHISLACTLSLIIVLHLVSPELFLLMSLFCLAR